MARAASIWACPPAASSSQSTARCSSAPTGKTVSASTSQFSLTAPATARERRKQLLDLAGLLDGSLAMSQAADVWINGVLSR